MLDDLLDELFHLLLGWVPDVVWGALLVVVGIGLTVVGVGLFSESPTRGGLFAGVGMLTVAGVLTAWYR